MPLVESLLLPITCFILGINAFVLIQSLVQTSQHHKFLALFFFASLINYSDDVFWRLEGWRWFPALTNLYIPFAYLMPVALYLYIQSLINPAKKLGLVNLHWLGFGLALICCLPYYSLDVSIKLARLSNTTGNLTHEGLAIWGPTIALLLFIPFGLVYIVLCLNLLKKNQIRIKTFFSNIEDKNLSWVRWAILILTLAWLVASVELMLPNAVSEKGHWSIVIAVFELAWLWVFAHFSLRQKILPIPNFSDSGKQNKTTDQRKYQRSPLTEPEVEQIKLALSGAIDEKLHRQAELSLQQLSESLKTPVNKISQVLNIHMDTGFYDYINKNRITDACQQLKTSKLNIIDIAYLVGFNSKSTFNSAFKKNMGMTPSQYKNQSI